MKTVKVCMKAAAALCLLIAACVPSHAAALPARTPDEAQAYAFLKSLPRKWAGEGQFVHSTYDCHTYEDKNIDGLVPAFAVRTAAFLRAFRERYGTAVALLTVMSAYRSKEEQACVCEGERGPCAGSVWVRKRVGKRLYRFVHKMLRGKHSAHERGEALDVRAGVGLDVEYQCMQDFASYNPQYGIFFPLGMHDRPHMRANGVSERSVRLVAPSRPVPSCEKIDLKYFGGIF